ncbi:MAG: hypothetical protein COB78_03360 [Hyphomicrobiales bacterium]|nr:MAG: hypothetical protein COB78_03360 [Hyphomicrobiales bacterium]
MFGSGIKTILKTTLASTLVAATMFGASAPVANAGNFEVAIGLGGPDGFSIQSIDYKHGHKKKHWKHGGNGKHHGGYGKHGGYGNKGGYGRHNYGCSPRRAVSKAWNMGLNHPHVKRVGRRHIVVKGGYRGSRAKVVFSRYGGCRVVDFQHHYW